VLPEQIRGVNPQGAEPNRLDFNQPGLTLEHPVRVPGNEVILFGINRQFRVNDSARPARRTGHRIQTNICDLPAVQAAPFAVEVTRETEPVLPLAMNGMPSGENPFLAEVEFLLSNCHARLDGYNPVIGLTRAPIRLGHLRRMNHILPTQGRGVILLSNDLREVGQDIPVGATSTGKLGERTLQLDSSSSSSSARISSSGTSGSVGGCHSQFTSLKGIPLAFASCRRL